MKDEMNFLGLHRIPFVFIIDFLMQNPVIIPVNDVDRSELMYDFNGFSNARCDSLKTKKIHFRKKPVSYERYKTAFDRIVEHQIQGDSYLANLTFPTSIDINLTLKEIFFLSRASYKLWYRDTFIVFSPEPFIRIENGKISSYPMKGTIDASIPGAREILLGDEKEYAEHVTIVDLIRNDLNMVSTAVTVERFRYIDIIDTHAGSLLQASSHITGTLPRDYHRNIGSIITALLPAGSVTGAPKKKTVDRIGKRKCKVIFSTHIHEIIFEPYQGRTIKSLKAVYCNDIEYPHKYVDRERIHELFLLRDQCDDILIVKNNNVTDTSIGNIVFYDGCQWVTPRTALLKGTKRELLLTQGVIREADIGISDITDFKKACLINAMLDLGEMRIEIRNIIF